MSQNEKAKITIEIPKKLFELIADMAKNVNEQYKTGYSAKDLIGKYVIQYFGTKNQLDIMAFSAQRFQEHTGDLKEEIMELYNTFQEMALKFDEISMKSGRLFLDVIKRLEQVDQEEENHEPS